jgi:HAD superfamily hydrolase (TIGR01509 family)
VNYAAIIFDCDGTLVDSMPAHYEAWVSTLNRYGMDLDEDEFYALGGWPTYHVADLVIRRSGGTVNPAALSIEKEAAFEQNLHRVERIDPVVAVAQEHFGRIPLGVATGGTRVICEGVLDSTGLKSMFGAIVTCDDVTRHKPAPDIYLEAARRLNVDPLACLAYEDTDPGIAAARAAGMQVIDVRTIFRPRRVRQSK